MPIRDLPRSFRRLGKIRLGEQVEAQSGGRTVSRPAKLEHWRLTSPSRELLEPGVAVYGGELRPWTGAPGEEDQFELYTTSKTLDIVIPPVRLNAEGDVAGGPFSQFYELWSAGGCQRRCDGIDELISATPCSQMNPPCPADHEARAAEAAKGKACKMTTRVMVILPKLPDLGVWMLETHGWYAAVELGAFMEFLARRAPGQFVEAKLRLESRTVKRKGTTHHFAVPVIELPQATAGELLSGAAGGGQRELPTGDGGSPPVDPETGEVYETGGFVYETGATNVVVDRPFDESDEKLVPAETVRAFVLKLKEDGFDDAMRAAIVHRATRGRTESSRAVLKSEWAMVENVRRALLDGLLCETVVDGTVRLMKTDRVEAEAS